MIKYTKATLNKLLQILEESGYIVRFEKGNFVSGYAIVKNRKIIIVNKFFDTESRIMTLLEILDYLPVEKRILTAKSKAFYGELIKKGLIKNDLKYKNEEE